MQEVITVENTEMQIREHKGQRVVTFKDVDNVHQRKKGTSRNTFNRNKKHFVEGVDYIILKPEKQSEADYVRLTYIPQKGVTLLTESGYLMIVKTFNDDLAWDVQRQLVNAYFNGKNVAVKQLLTQEPGPKYITSDTQIRCNPIWYERNKRRIGRICDRLGISTSKLFHEILKYLGEGFDLEYANYMYEKEKGVPPEYAMDVVNYFTQLSKKADSFLNRLEEAIEKRKIGI